MRPSRTIASSSCWRGCFSGCAEFPECSGCASTVVMVVAGSGWSAAQLARRVVELALDLRQLLLATHDSRTLEPSASPAVVVDEEHGERADHERPRDVARGREAEQDHQHDDPDDRDPGDRLGPPAEVPDPMAQPV